MPGVRSATTLVVILATITGANLFTEPYLLTNGGGPDGASTSPVFVMYQKGIEQGNPDTAVRDRRDAGDRRARSSRSSTASSWSVTDMQSTHDSGARAALFLGALVFLFPFYYMVVGSLQKKPDTTAQGRLPHRRADAAQLRGDQQPRGPGPVAAQLGDLHRRRAARHGGVRRARRLRPGPAALPRPRHAVRGDAARADHPVPAADHPDLRDDRAHLRAGRHLRWA